jgi:hypothetical protein
MLVAIAVAHWPDPARACFSNDCDPAGVTRTAQGVVFQGIIHAAAVDEAERMLRDGDSLLIDSMGGDIDSAIRLGKLVRQRNVKVRARYQCFSTCAQYVFLPAPTKSVDRGGTVMFDVPASFQLELLRRLGPAAKPGAMEMAEARSTAERELYTEAGIGPAFLGCFAAALRGDLDQLRTGDSDAAVAGLAAAMRAERVMFTRGGLERYGVAGIEAYQADESPAGRNETSVFWGYKIAWVDAGLSDCAKAPVTLPRDRGQ